MVFDPAKADLVVGIVGAGAMGRGIAQVAATGGMRAVIFDTAPGAADAAIGFVAGMLERAAEKGRMTAPEAAAAAGRLTAVADLSDLAAADLVVEAVVEDVAVKREIFARLAALVGPEAVLASNTSSIRIAGIAAGSPAAPRIAGMHFFNPVPLMKLVEVIAAPETSPATVEALLAIGRRMGRVPVAVKDSPGFLVNLGGRAFVTEGLRIVSEGVAEPAQVDAVMRDAWGYRMGPFELMDLTGIDVNFPVSRIVYEGYFHDRRLATQPLHEAMNMAGRLGRKTGAGFYDYDADGTKLAPPADAPGTGPAAPVLVLAEPDEELAALCRDAGARVVAADDGQAPIVAAPLGEDATALATRLELDPRRLVALDLLSNPARRLTVMVAPGADPAVLDAVVARFAQPDRPVTAIKDSPGFIGQRIQAMVANLGCEMAQARIATPEDIDKGMELGLNYPSGPLKLADRIGPEMVLAILETLQAITGDDRYRPALWLRRRALLGLSALTPD